MKLLLARQADIICYFAVVGDTVFPTALQYCLRDEMMMRLLLNNGYDADKCFCCTHDSTWDDLSDQTDSNYQEKVSVSYHLKSRISHKIHILTIVINALTNLFCHPCHPVL